MRLKQVLIMTDDKLNTIRKKIDTIDNQLLSLLKDRANLAVEVAQIKQGQHQPIYYRPEREAQVLRKIVEKNDTLLPDKEVTRIFRDIMTACLALQQSIKVAYLGPEGTFSQQAVLKHFGESIDLHAESSIPEVFKQVAADRVHYGVVPIENSSEGLINTTLDSLINFDVQICGEISLRIRHNLARKAPKKPLKTIYAHPQAFAQCREWLSTHYPDVPLHEVASNGLAAQMASEQEHSAAICGDKAVEIYHLTKVHEYIEDQSNNTTRFIIIGKQLPGPSGYDKTSLIIATADKPGSLLHILSPLDKHKINMTMIESRPYRLRNWSYMFFIDFQGHQFEPRIQVALKELASTSIMLTVLGSYPEAAG